MIHSATANHPPHPKPQNISQNMNAPLGQLPKTIGQGGGPDAFAESDRHLDKRYPLGNRKKNKFGREQGTALAPLVLDLLHRAALKQLVSTANVGERIGGKQHLDYLRLEHIREFTNEPHGCTLEDTALISARAKDDGKILRIN